jgi:hypothetical protein
MKQIYMKSAKELTQALGNTDLDDSIRIVSDFRYHRMRNDIDLHEHRIKRCHRF